MSIQTSTLRAKGIPTGFGQRLKEERKRLRLNQTELAQVGGVGRLAQLQYESEATAPTTRYLSAIAAAGIDLAYLVLGLKLQSGVLTPEQHERVESRAFAWVDICAEKKTSRMTSEERRTLYQIIRSVLVQMELGKLPADFDTNLLVSQHTVNRGEG